MRVRGVEERDESGEEQGSVGVVGYEMEVNYTFVEKYSYKWPIKVLVFSFIIPLGFATAMLVIALLAGLILWTQGGTFRSFEVFGALILAIPFFGFFIVVFSNMYPDIKLFEQGIAVQVFLFWWIFINWEEIEDIRPTFGGFSQSRLVIVQRLTPVHRLFGWMYSYSLKPAFLIMPTLEGYKELIQVIKQKINEVG